MEARQTKVVNKCKLMLGSKNWDISTERISEDKKVIFNKNQKKDYLFIYEMLTKGGVEDILDDNNNPYTCLQWHKEEVPDMILVGYGIDGLNKSWPGDIVTDGFHIGIISGPQKTIHISEKNNIVVEDNWGWRKEDFDKVKIFRYDPED